MNAGNTTKGPGVRRLPSPSPRPSPSGRDSAPLEARTEPLDPRWSTAPASLLGDRFRHPSGVQDQKGAWPPRALPRAKFRWPSGPEKIRAGGAPELRRGQRPRNRTVAFSHPGGVPEGAPGSRKGTIIARLFAKDRSGGQKQLGAGAERASALECAGATALCTDGPVLAGEHSGSIRCHRPKRRSSAALQNARALAVPTSPRRYPATTA